MASALQVQRIPLGLSGLDSTSAARAASNASAVKLENMLADRPGMVRQRGPLQAATGAAITSGQSPAYPVVLGNEVMIAQTTTTSRDTTSVILPLGTQTAATQSSAMVPVAPSVEVNGSAYFPTNTLVNVGEIMRWDAGTHTLVRLTQGPYGAGAVCAHLGRLFALRGYNPGAGTTIPLEPATLYWTDVGGSPTNSLNEWKDDVSGLVNKIQLDGGSAPGTPGGKALTQLGRNMAIFASDSIFMLTGDTPSTFAVRQVIRGVTARSNKAVQEWDDGCFFISDDATVYFFDGSGIAEISGPIASDLQAAEITSGTFYLARVDDHQLAVLSSGQGMWLYNTRTRAWSTATFGGAAAASVPLMIGNTRTIGAFMWDGSYVWPLRNGTLISSVTSPSTSFANTRGFDNNTTTATTSAIATKTWSKTYLLGNPVNKAQLHRVMVEYDLRVIGTPIPDGQGLYLSLYDSTGTQIMAPVNLPVGTSRQVQQFDVFAETADVQVRIEYANTSPTNVTKLELYDAWVEYSVTRQRA